MDCPICLTEIDSVSNKVTTECGHSFHCSCLMHNVLVNGFRCPYCRTAMAQRTPATPATGHLSDRLVSITLPVALPNPPAFEPVSPTGPPPVGPGLAAEEALDASIRESMLALADLFAPEPAPERVRVKRAIIGGKAVFMTVDNIVYNPDTREEIGKWNNATGTLMQRDDSTDTWRTVWTLNSGLPMPMEHEELSNPTMEVYERFVKVCEEGKLESARDMYEKYGDIIKKESDFMSGKIFLDIYKQKEDNLPKWLFSVLKAQCLITSYFLYDLLYDAVLFGDLASVDWFYSELCKMCEFRDGRFEFAYSLACSKMYLHIVNYFRFLLSKYINFNKIEIQVFYAALSDGNVSLLEFILAINPNISINYKDCFVVACQKGYLEIAKRVYTEVEPYVLDTGFCDACKQGHLEFAQWLMPMVKPMFGYRRLESYDQILLGQEYIYDEKVTYDEKVCYLQTNQLFKQVCQKGHIEVAQWLYSIFDNIDLLFQDGMAFQYACWDADVSQSHLELAQWLEQLNPYLFEIYYNEEGLFSHYKIDLDREKKWRQRRYALWLSSNESPKRDNLLYKIPEDVSRYLISNYL